jgi:pimeloyl-ACP methyl ester carboxylesterase
LTAGPRAAPTLPKVCGSGIFQRLCAPADRGLRHDEWVEPILAFFPGASGSSEFWRPVAERFSSRRTVQLLSWPGAGAEPHDRAIDGYDDLITYAAAAIPDRSDVVAQSMGGVVAVGLALSQPQKIRRLVLVATSGGLDVAGNGAGDWRAEYRQEFPQAAAWVTGHHADFTDQLHRITIPTCLIWGDCDPRQSSGRRACAPRRAFQQRLPSHCRRRPHACARARGGSRRTDRCTPALIRGCRFVAPDERSGHRLLL